MSSRKVDIIIICEDNQHVAFARRFLEKKGFNPRRINAYPSSGGDAKTHVRERYPIEIRAMRQRSAATVLIIVTDADELSVAKRKETLGNECNKLGINDRQNGEKIGIFIPRRNIETWIHFLQGNEVDEETTYKKYEYERECSVQIKRLVELCEQSRMPDGTPPSLQDACEEFKRIQ